MTHECQYATAAHLDPFMLTASVGKARRNVLNHMVTGCGAFAPIAKALMQKLTEEGRAKPGGKKGKLEFHDGDVVVASLSCGTDEAKLSVKLNGVHLCVTVKAGTIQESLEQLARFLAA